MEENKNNILRIAIAFFLIINITILLLVYVLIDNQIKTTQMSYETKIEYLSRERESLLEKINIVNSSKEDINSNLIDLKKKIEKLDQQINTSLNKDSFVQDKTSYYQNQIDVLNNKNIELISLKQDLQNQILLKENQKIMQQQKVVVKRKTRSS